MKRSSAIGRSSSGRIDPGVEGGGGGGGGAGAGAVHGGLPGAEVVIHDEEGSDDHEELGERNREGVRLRTQTLLQPTNPIIIFVYFQ